MDTSKTPPAASRKSTKWEIEARWTPKLAETGWTPIVDAFLKNYSALGITSNEAMFVVHLMSHKWNEKMPYPSFVTIAGRMGVTDTSVRSYARALEKRKLIKRIGRSGQSSAFDMEPLFAALEKKLADNEAKPVLTEGSVPV